MEVQCGTKVEHIFDWEHGLNVDELFRCNPGC